MVAAIREIDTNHLIIVERLYGTNQEYSNTAAVQQFLVDDDNIECVDFVYPISFSLYDSAFQILDTVVIEND